MNAVSRNPATKELVSCCLIDSAQYQQSKSGFNKCQRRKMPDSVLPTGFCFVCV